MLNASYWAGTERCAGLRRCQGGNVRTSRANPGALAEESQRRAQHGRFFYTLRP
jgi:hypothetical protein